MSEKHDRHVLLDLVAEPDVVDAFPVEEREELAGDETPQRLVRRKKRLPEALRLLESFREAHRDENRLGEQEQHESDRERIESVDEAHVEQDLVDAEAEENHDADHRGQSAFAPADERAGDDEEKIGYVADGDDLVDGNGNVKDRRRKEEEQGEENTESLVDAHRDERQVAREYRDEVRAVYRDADIKGQMVDPVEDLPWNTGEKAKEEPLAVDEASDGDDKAENAEPQRRPILSPQTEQAQVIQSDGQKGTENDEIHREAPHVHGLDWPLGSDDETLVDASPPLRKIGDLHEELVIPDYGIEGEDVGPIPRFYGFARRADSSG